ncbi:unnamed protein product [Parajaminaea phylloscopi]
MSAFRALRAVSKLSSAATAKSQGLHTSAATHAFSKFLMPAMSPTMTEGGLAAWKVKEGQSFSAGDVLLEIETDKATMDVEAQDDGMMAKIIVQDGGKNIAVGKMIAILAEEGDDLAQAESQVGGDKAEPSPAEASSSSSSAQGSSSKGQSSSSSSAPDLNPAAPNAPTPPPTQSHHGTPDFPMFPSVLRLLNENNIAPQDARGKIKGTGVRGMITKGDVLVHLGKVKTPTGSYKDQPSGISDLGGPPSGKPAQPPTKDNAEPLTAQALRSAILGGLALTSRSHQSRSASALEAQARRATRSSEDALEAAVADYSTPVSTKPLTTSRPQKDWLEGLL